MSVWSSDARVDANEVDATGCGDDPFFDVAHTRLDAKHVTRISVGNGQAFLTRSQAIALFLSLGDFLARGPLPAAADPGDAAARRSLRELVQRFRAAGR